MVQLLPTYRRTFVLQQLELRIDRSRKRLNVVQDSMIVRTRTRTVAGRIFFL